MTTHTATLTPEHIALTSTLNLSESYQYYRLLCKLTAGLSEDGIRNLHLLIMETAMLRGLRATAHIALIGFVQVASPIAVALELLEMDAWEQKQLQGSEGEI
jgi:hypothetical protein